jgi:hypothetical protein
MKSKFSLMKSIAVTAALVAGVSGVARADDSSMARFGGDSYAYFHEGKPVVDKSPSAFRETNPLGLSERQYQALSNEDQVWQLEGPVIDRTPSTFRQNNPHGLSFGDYQALSSNDAMWQLPNRSQTSAIVSTHASAVAKAPVK